METPEEVVKGMKAAAEIEPLVEGVEKLAKYAQSESKKLGDKLSTLEATNKAAIEDLESRTNKSVEDVLVRIDRLKDRSSAFAQAAFGVTAGDDQLKSVISQRIKDAAGTFTAFAKSRPREDALSDPLVAMAMHEWFLTSTRSQCSKHFAAQMSENAIQRDKLFAALQEKVFGANWEAITKAAYAEGAAGTGGNLVPTIVEADIVRQLKDAGKLFPLARQVQMTSNVHQMPAENTAVTVNWIAEAGSLTAGEGTFAQRTLTAKKLAGRATMSIEVVEDSNPGLLPYLLEVFTEKMAGEADKQLVLGDGSGPAITGVMNASGINVIASSATAAGRALTWQLLVDTYVGAQESDGIDDGYWVVSPRGFALIFGLSETGGQPIVKFADTLTSPTNQTILGRPVLRSARWGGSPSGVTATFDDATNDNTRIMYGKPSSLIFGTRSGFRWDVTDQVNWATYSMDARLIGRFAMVTGVPGNWNTLNKLNTPAF